MTNKEEQTEYHRKWLEKNREKYNQYRRKHYQENKEGIHLYYKEYRQKNKERIIKLHQKWRGKNRERYNLYCKLQERQLSKDSPKHRIDGNIKSHIYKALKKRKAGRKWEDLVGYTLKDLIEHLERLFSPEMNWDNYGNYWEIDHKIPKSLFNYIYPEDPKFKECWALRNLQPLEVGENRRKYNSLSKED